MIETRIRAGDAKGVLGSVDGVAALRGLLGERTPVSATEEKKYYFTK